MHGAQPGPQFDTTATEDDAFAFLADKLPVEDLTAAALAGELAPPTNPLDRTDDTVIGVLTLLVSGEMGRWMRLRFPLGLIEFPISGLDCVRGGTRCQTEIKAK